MHATFNIIDLTLFASSTDEEVETCGLRKNSLIEGGDDGRRPNSGPTTRAMARKIQED